MNLSGYKRDKKLICAHRDSLFFPAVGFEAG